MDKSRQLFTSLHSTSSKFYIFFNIITYEDYIYIYIWKVFPTPPEQLLPHPGTHGEADWLVSGANGLKKLDPFVVSRVYTRI